MLHFVNGFVFTSEPNFKAVSAAVPGRFARGYKHKQRPIWLLDFWKPRGKLLLPRRSDPFCEPVTDRSQTNFAAVDAPTRNFLVALQSLTKMLRSKQADPQLRYVHLALFVAEAAGCPAFLFAGDTVCTDMGCNAVPGSLVSVACRLDWLSVCYGDGQTTVTSLNRERISFNSDGYPTSTPLTRQEEDDEFQKLIAGTKNVAEKAVAQPNYMDDGPFLYRNSVELWPIEAGDPAEILGLGTLDPLQKLEADFTVVFEHLTQ